MELRLLNGETFRLSDHRGKVVVLDFWATWCKPCVMGMPKYIDAMKEFSPEEATFIAVNLGEPASTIERFLTESGWDLTVALDTQNKAAGEYSVRAVPHLVLINTKGEVVDVKIGYSPTAAKELKDRIRELL